MNNINDLWGAAILAGKSIHHNIRIDELKCSISKIGTQCGDCSKWMTSDCPKEKNVNGRNRGPSMSEVICDKFSISFSAISIKEHFENELKKELELTIS